MSNEVTRAAIRILGGGDSAAAAADLERAIHAYQPFDDDLEDLLGALALYAPSLGSPYIDHLQLCEAIRRSSIFASQKGGSP